MRLRVNNTWAIVDDITGHERAQLDQFFQALIPPEDRPSTSKHATLFDGKQFPAGLLPLLDTKFRTDSNRPNPAVPRVRREWDRLRPYQSAALNAWARARRGILELPPGAGKTEILIAATQEIAAPWLVLVNRRSLVEQTIRRFQIWGVNDIGYLLGQERIKVATVQSVAAALRRKEGAPVEVVHNAGALCADEVHGFAARDAWNVAMCTHSAEWRLGLSATPIWRGDRRDAFTVGAFGPVVYSVSMRELVENGFLAEGSAHFHPFEHRDAKYVQLGWSEFYRRFVTSSTERNELVVELARRAKAPCLVFVREIEHGARLQDIFRRRGLRAELVTGADDVATRRQLVDLLVAGEHSVLISSPVFEEGIDIPELASVVVASGGKGLIASVQRIGRACRRAEGKLEFELHDIADAGHRWLDRHTRARALAYAKAGFRPKGVTWPLLDPAAVPDVVSPRPQKGRPERWPVTNDPLVALVVSSSLSIVGVAAAVALLGAICSR